GKPTEDHLPLLEESLSMHVVKTPDRQHTHLELEHSHDICSQHLAIHPATEPCPAAHLEYVAACCRKDRARPRSVLHPRARRAPCVISALREVNHPFELFDHHATADAELAFISSLIGPAGLADLAYDILDSAYLARWNELVARGSGPEELPPLRPSSAVRKSAPNDGC